jgi:hypothetical protein
MKCPVCGTWTVVKETRGERRRRECANLHKFTTQESVVKIGPSASTKKTDACTKTPSRVEKSTLSPTPSPRRGDLLQPQLPAGA